MPQDDAEALRWYRKAAEQGDALAQAYLSLAYRRELGVPRDYPKAARWYLKLFGQCALRTARRYGWTPLAGVLLFLIFLASQRFWEVPGGCRWRRCPESAPVRHR